MSVIGMLNRCGMTRIVFAGLLGLTLCNTAWAFPTYAGGKGIWGAELMTEQERQHYVQRIQDMQSYQECTAYVAAHRKEIQARAVSQKIDLPPPPSQSPCDVMQMMGRFKRAPIYY